MTSTERPSSAALLDTRPKRLHLVATGVFSAVVVYGMVREALVENEQDIGKLFSVLILMAVSLVSSLFVMTLIERKAPVLRRAAYFFLPLASLVVVLAIRSSGRMWWKWDLAFWLASYSAAYVLLGIVMLLTIPVLAVWRWVTAV